MVIIRTKLFRSLKRVGGGGGKEEKREEGRQGGREGRTNKRKKGRKERSHYSDTINIQIKPTYHPFVHSCFHNYISPLSLSHCSTRLTPSPAFLLVSILGRDPGVAGPLCLAPPFIWTCLFLSKLSCHLTVNTPPLCYALGLSWGLCSLHVLYLPYQVASQRLTTLCLRKASC